ncbi:MAG: hypothetical protein FWB78_06805 [Treponema sp.]|nr:hypothetical protein [Treponema sp.]
MAANGSFPEAEAGVDAGESPWAGEGMELHPKKRIFLSVDIIGSTSAKKGSTSDEWVEGFAAFLHSVNILYQNKFSKVIGKHCRDTCEKKPCLPKFSQDAQDDPAEAQNGSSEGERPPYHAVHFWKYIGDEVVLTADLFCKKHHASMHVLALAETVKEFNRKDRMGCDVSTQEALAKFGNKLRVKAFAWVGGFPVRNIELRLRGQKSQYVKDFLGPSIDLGFRLAKFASEDKLVISPSLAYLIASEPGDDKSHVPLCFGGMVELKGIKDQQPLIWYPVNKTKENDLCGVQHVALLDLLKEHLKQSSPVLPFIPDPSDDGYKEMYKAVAEAQKDILGSPFYRPKEKAPSADVSTEKQDSELEAEGDRFLSELAKGAWPASLSPS